MSTVGIDDQIETRSGHAGRDERLPRIAVTMGDAAGVGPELCLRILSDADVRRICTPIVFGDAGVLSAVSEATGLPCDAPIARVSECEAALAALNEPAILDFASIGLHEFQPGASNAATGRAAFAYVNRAIDAALAGRVVAVSTGPLCKEALHQAGHPFPGHTEIFSARCDALRSCMMQYSDEITCSFVTVHVGYRDVPALLSVERILDVIELTVEAMRRIRGREPSLVVCGLNPHAGEHGLFGDREEERIIEPAIAEAQRRGFRVAGPLPPDTAFVPQRRRTTDAFICMYHDQGHIPVKALAFDSAVNTTLGLPIVRTSVDHGTAPDIAWTGTANPGSFFAAIRLAVRLANRATV